MKHQKLTALLATAMICAMVVVPTFAATAEESKEPGTVTGTVEIMPLDLDLDGGDIKNSATGLEKTIKLNQRNGKYVNLYVENKGNVAVVATINGEKPKTFQPGEKGHIYVEVTQGFLGMDKSYTFKVAPVSGEATFRYDIAQRDYQ